MRLIAPETWRQPPGNMDSLNTSMLFPSGNALGIPEMEPCTMVPANLVPYAQWKAWSDSPNGAACHFFLDDYRFESIWRKPNRHLLRFLELGTVITPDFSVYTDWPSAVNVYQTYRNRWLGCYWQRFGLQVIPSVSWSTPDSLEYAFLGIPRGNVVAIQTQAVDVRDTEQMTNVKVGMEALQSVVQPNLVLVYGKVDRLPRIAGLKIREYATAMDCRRKVLKDG